MYEINDNLVSTKHWYENGSKSKVGRYKDGSHDGLWIDWYDNGQKRQVRYFEKGLEEGKWTYWDENGQITSQEEYKEGMCISGC